MILNLNVFIAGVACFGVIMIVLYMVKYKGTPLDVYKPGAAWTRAMIFFSICYTISWATGTMETLLNQPIATAENLADKKWIAFCSACFLYNFVAYWVLWSRMTLTFDRKFSLVPQIFFGLIWGSATGQLLLSFYHVANMTGWPGWAVYLLAYVCMGFFQYLFHDLFWDVYVSPEHDTPRSIMIKTMVCHIPNVLICLCFLVIYENYLIYVLTQTFALVAASIFQKFPAPWDKSYIHAPMLVPGLFGLPRGSGYIEEKAK